jgi:hypothetical protein
MGVNRAKVNDHHYNHALKPMSWGNTVPREVRPIKPGFAGYLPNASTHYGSSHYGGLPIYGGGHADLPHKGRPPMACASAYDLMAGGEHGKNAELNMISSAEIGRSAWNLEWARCPTALHAQQYATRPRTPATANGSRAQTPPASYRQPRTMGLPSSVSRQEQQPSQQPEYAVLPSFRQRSFTPMSRDPRGPSAAHAAAVGGIRPGYMGHIPRVLNHYGSTHVGGSYERQDLSLPGMRGGPTVYGEGEIAGGSDQYTQANVDRWLAEKGTAGDFRHALSA